MHPRATLALRTDWILFLPKNLKKRATKRLPTENLQRTPQRLLEDWALIWMATFQTESIFVWKLSLSQPNLQQWQPQQHMYQK